jgi:hypothetical protein
VNIFPQKYTKKRYHPKNPGKFGFMGAGLYFRAQRWDFGTQKRRFENLKRRFCFAIPDIR